MPRDALVAPISFVHDAHHPVLALNATPVHTSPPRAAHAAWHAPSV